MQDNEKHRNDTNGFKAIYCKLNNTRTHLKTQTQSSPMEQLQKTSKETIKSIDATPEDRRGNDDNGATPEQKLTFNDNELTPKDSKPYDAD